MIYSKKKIERILEQGHKRADEAMKGNTTMVKVPWGGYVNRKYASAMTNLMGHEVPMVGLHLLCVNIVSGMINYKEAGDRRKKKRTLKHLFNSIEELDMITQNYAGLSPEDMERRLMKGLVYGHYHKPEPGETQEQIPMSVSPWDPWR